MAPGQMVEMSRPVASGILTGGIGNAVFWWVFLGVFIGAVVNRILKSGAWRFNE